MHSFIQQDPKFRQGGEGPFEEWRKLSQKPKISPNASLASNAPVPIPKPAIGKVNGIDMIGLTSPGRHPQRACGDFTPPLKILTTPYLNKIKILIAREKGRMGVEQASRRICTVIFFRVSYSIYFHIFASQDTLHSCPQTVLAFWFLMEGTWTLPMSYP